jgi:Fe-S-cluster-containing dehydrogenase component/DMSO reductase anchor subunit
MPATQSWLASSIGGAPDDGDSLDRLVSTLLDDQRDLTAVARFAQLHEHETEPLHARYYSALLPSQAPGPGQQYAFEVDLDRCTGCKACVAACHALNGLDDEESWRDVGLIIGGTPSLPVLQHVTSSCHHCLDPACLNVCPVNAYEKDPVTGIVRHLDDQCFGCQYCTLACPYDAPKFQKAKGIVRKCDMCSDRLRSGEPPACVSACPHDAIRIRVVERDAIEAMAAMGDFLPAAPEPGYTLPTTQYRSLQPACGTLRAADDHRNVPEPAHYPLAVALVLTQAATGVVLADAVLRVARSSSPAALSLIGVVLALVGIAASVFHLGRPLYAYRALIGIRHSWLSREVLAFGVFAALGVAHASAVFGYPSVATMTACLASMAALAALTCSVMVYHVVRRPFWHAGISAPKFLGTVALAALAASLIVNPASGALCTLLVVATVCRLITDGAIFTHLHDIDRTSLKRTAELLIGPLAPDTRLRTLLGGIGGIALPLILVGSSALSPSWPRAVLAVTSFLVVLGGELIERVLFFKAVVRPKMPGGVVS